MEYYGLAGMEDVRPGDTVSPSEHFLLIRIPPQYSCDIEGLPHNIFPLEWERFVYHGGKGRSVALRQFPVVLAYAITDYKSQGQTYDAVVADLRKPQGFASPASFYVPLSLTNWHGKRPWIALLLSGFESDWIASMAQSGIRSTFQGR